MNKSNNKRYQITDEKIENKYIELIKKGLKEMDAPEEQYERLNLK